MTIPPRGPSHSIIEKVISIHKHHKEDATPGVTNLEEVGEGNSLEKDDDGFTEVKSRKK